MTGFLHYRVFVSKSRQILIRCCILGQRGTADIAIYLRYVGHPFLHIHTRLHIVRQYDSLSFGSKITHMAAKRHFAVSKQTVYQGPVLTDDQYQLRMPNGEEIVRDIVEPTFRTSF